MAAAIIDEIKHLIDAESDVNQVDVALAVRLAGLGSDVEQICELEKIKTIQPLWYMMLDGSAEECFDTATAGKLWISTYLIVQAFKVTDAGLLDLVATFADAGVEDREAFIAALESDTPRIPRGYKALLTKDLGAHKPPAARAPSPPEEHAPPVTAPPAPPAPATPATENIPFPKPTRLPVGVAHAAFASLPDETKVVALDGGMVLLEKPTGFDTQMLAPCDAPTDHCVVLDHEKLTVRKIDNDMRDVLMSFDDGIPFSMIEVEVTGGAAESVATLKFGVAPPECLEETVASKTALHMGTLASAAPGLMTLVPGSLPAGVVAAEATAALVASSPKVVCVVATQEASATGMPTLTAALKKRGLGVLFVDADADITGFFEKQRVVYVDKSAYDALHSNAALRPALCAMSPWIFPRVPSIVHYATSPFARENCEIGAVVLAERGQAALRFDGTVSIAVWGDKFLQVDLRARDRAQFDDAAARSALTVLAISNYTTVAVPVAVAKQNLTSSWLAQGGTYANQMTQEKCILLKNVTGLSYDNLAKIVQRPLPGGSVPMTLAGIGKKSAYSSVCTRADLQLVRMDTFQRPCCLRVLAMVAAAVVLEPDDPLVGYDVSEVEGFPEIWSKLLSGNTTSKKRNSPSYTHKWNAQALLEMQEYAKDRLAKGLLTLDERQVLVEVCWAADHGAIRNSPAAALLAAPTPLQKSQYDSAIVRWWAGDHHSQGKRFRGLSKKWTPGGSKKI